MGFSCSVSLFAVLLLRIMRPQLMLTFQKEWIGCWLRSVKIGQVGQAVICFFLTGCRVFSEWITCDSSNLVDRLVFACQGRFSSSKRETPSRNRAFVLFLFFSPLLSMAEFDQVSFNSKQHFVAFKNAASKKKEKPLCLNKSKRNPPRHLRHHPHPHLLHCPLW